MPDEQLHTCAYRVLRYTPNLVRDEWVNIGILIHDPAAQRLKARLIEEVGEFARVRRLHPGADENLLRALPTDFEKQIGEHGADLAGLLAKLDETLSNVLQLSPPKGVLTEDIEAELDRLYRDHVEPPRFRAAAAELPNTRNAIRGRMSEVLRSAGIWTHLRKRFRVEEFTHPGDPLKLDFAYRQNGTQGFLHALPLSRDPGVARDLAYTVERMRTRLADMELTAITEMKPLPTNPVHQFVSSTLREQGIPIVPLPEFAPFVNLLRSRLRRNGNGENTARR